MKLIQTGKGGSSNPSRRGIIVMDEAVHGLVDSVELGRER
jgi:hypothetical protein